MLEAKQSGYLLGVPSGFNYLWLIQIQMYNTSELVNNPNLILTSQIPSKSVKLLQRKVQ